MLELVQQEVNVESQHPTKFPLKQLVEDAQTQLAALRKSIEEFIDYTEKLMEQAQQLRLSSHLMATGSEQLDSQTARFAQDLQGVEKTLNALHTEYTGETEKQRDRERERERQRAGDRVRERERDRDRKREKTARQRSEAQQ